MIVLIVIIVLLVLIALYVVSIYNSLVNQKNQVQEAWSSIDVFLKKRYDLVPNLVETVKGYATHEKELLENITKARNLAVNAATVKEQSEAESSLKNAMMNVFAIAENYPTLQANQNFIHLQNELSSLEDDIEMARRYYNGTVKDYNVAIDSFPSNLVAQNFSHTKADYFEIENQAEKQPINVQF